MTARHYPSQWSMCGSLYPYESVTPKPCSWGSLFLNTVRSNKENTVGTNWWKKVEVWQVICTHHSYIHFRIKCSSEKITINFSFSSVSSPSSRWVSALQLRSNSATSFSFFEFSNTDLATSLLDSVSAFCSSGESEFRGLWTLEYWLSADSDYATSDISISPNNSSNPIWTPFVRAIVLDLSTSSSKCEIIAFHILLALGRPALRASKYNINLSSDL